MVKKLLVSLLIATQVAYGSGVFGGSGGGGSGTPGGSDTEVQYNNAGSFGGVTGVSATEAGYLNGVSSAIQTQLDAKAPSTSPAFATSARFSYGTASRVPYLDSNKDLITSSVTSTELGYLSGVTSAIQTQLGTKVTANEWAAYTPGSLWSTNTTITGYYKVVGDEIWVKVKVALSGAPDAQSLTIDLPSGCTIDTNKEFAQDNDGPMWGHCNVADTGVIGYLCVWNYVDTNTMRAQIVRSSSTYADFSSPVNATTPITFGNGDSVWGRFTVPGTCS